MFGNYKVIALVPGGRRAYMRALMPHLVANLYIDEIKILLNTKNEFDIAFMQNIKDSKIELFSLPDNLPPNGSKTVNYIYSIATDDNAIYIKIDDDVVWMKDDAIENLLRGRINYTDAFLVSPLVINNSLCTHMLQANRKVDFIDNYIRANAGDLAWKDGKFAEKMHLFLLENVKKNSTENLYIPNQFFASNRFSINCICLWGRDIKKIGGQIEPIWRYTDDDEEYLSIHAPAKLGKYNVIIGNSLVSHHSFLPQTAMMNKSKVLSEYQDISAKKCDLMASFPYVSVQSKSICEKNTSDQTLHNYTYGSACSLPIMFVSFPQQGTDFFCDQYSKTSDAKYFREFFNPLCNNKMETVLSSFFGDERKERQANIFRRLSADEYDEIYNKTWKTQDYNVAKENYSPGNVVNHAGKFFLIGIFRHRALTVPTTYPHLAHATWNSFLINKPLWPAMEALKNYFLNMHLDSSQKEVVAHLVHWYTVFKSFEQIEVQKTQEYINVIDYRDLMLLGREELETLFVNCLPIAIGSAKNLAENICKTRFGSDNAQQWVANRRKVYTSMDIENFYQMVFSKYILEYDPEFVNSKYYCLMA